MLNWQDVADVVIELLAEDAGRSPDEVRASLGVAGGWPIDSLLLVEVLPRVEARFGVKIPETVEAARAFGTVQAFAEMVAAAASGAAGTSDGAA